MTENELALLQRLEYRQGLPAMPGSRLNGWPDNGAAAVAAPTAPDDNRERNIREIRRKIASGWRSPAEEIAAVDAALARSRQEAKDQLVSHGRAAEAHPARSSVFGLIRDKEAHAAAVRRVEQADRACVLGPRPARRAGRS